MKRAIICAFLLAATCHEPAYAAGGRRTFPIEVLRVVDGDTLRADIDLGFGVALRNREIRLECVNAPELSGATRTAGQAARDAARTWLTTQGAHVWLTTPDPDHTDKYGRVLGVVWQDELRLGSLNRHLLDTGHAALYLCADPASLGGP